MPTTQYVQVLTIAVFGHDRATEQVLYQQAVVDEMAGDRARLISVRMMSRRCVDWRYAREQKKIRRLLGPPGGFLLRIRGNVGRRQCRPGGPCS